MVVNVIAQMKDLLALRLSALHKVTNEWNAWPRAGLRSSFQYSSLYHTAAIFESKTFEEAVSFSGYPSQPSSVKNS